MVPWSVEEFVAWFSTTMDLACEVPHHARLRDDLALDDYDLFLVALALDDLTKGEGLIDEDLCGSLRVIDLYHRYLISLSSPPMVHPVVPDRLT